MKIQSNSHRNLSLFVFFLKSIQLKHYLYHNVFFSFCFTYFSLTDLTLIKMTSNLTRPCLSNISLNHFDSIYKQQNETPSKRDAHQLFLILLNAIEKWKEWEKQKVEELKVSCVSFRVFFFVVD